MQIDQIISGLNKKFETSRIVFWYDPDISFQSEISSIELGSTNILDMSKESLLQTKKRVEIDDPHGKYLLYFPQAEPAPEQDWMLDIRLYSQEFFADASSMLLNELGISNMSIRSLIHTRKAFFSNKQRFSALKKLITEFEDEETLERKMIAVVVKAESAALSDILLALLKNCAEFIDTDSDSELPLMARLSKYDLLDAFWTNIRAAYSYDSEQATLRDFILKLFCTELWSQIEAEDRNWLVNNVLKSASSRATALAFMSAWRDSKSFSQYHDKISAVIESQLEVAQRCKGYQPHEMIECETFESLEQAIIRGLVRDLLDVSTVVNRGAFELMLSKRLSGHWCSSNPGYVAIYEAIRNAERLLHLRQQYIDGFHFDSAKTLFSAYTDEIYQFDQAYRLFNEHVHTLLSKGAEILRPLGNLVEDIYTNWFLYELGTAWDRLVKNENLLENWSISGVPLQRQFFRDQVQSPLVAKKAKRVFVVISDALRYEIAHELTHAVNDEKRFKADLNPQLGVLPSYTQLGMASLLPHSNLSYKSDQGSVVYIDDKPTQGIQNRHAILDKSNGMAVTSKELMSWSNQEGREKVKDKEVIYIYHDTIDAIGDKGSTEDKTFEACRSAVTELRDLVGRIINRLNGSRVIVTADHGFLFQQKPLEQTEKTGLPTKPSGAIEAKKRYIIGENLPSNDACWKGKVKNTAGSECNTEFLLPKGASRFHFVGGAKFVHGGLMLQEICLPVIHIRPLHKKQAENQQKQRVGVVVANQPIKLVNNIDKVRFIQTDPVGNQFVARKLEIYIVDENGQHVSSRELLAFDSTSTNMDERTRAVRLKLIGANFDRNASYTLVMDDTDSKTRYSQYAVIIDLAFQDDFF